MVFFIALILAFALNVDSLQIANKLWAEPTLRQVVAAQASSTPSATSTSASSPLQVPTYLNSLSIPVGWTTEPVTDYKSCGFVIGQNTPPGYIGQNNSGQNQCNEFAESSEHEQFERMAFKFNWSADYCLGWRSRFSVLV